MSASCDPRMQVPVTPSGVSNCYVFKSRLQEYAQKVGLPTPTYETIREGPSHEPFFRSTVIVGGVRYDSLIGFTNRKAAEQSAAEVALMELCMCGDKKESIAVPVHETGLCKNLLQEYAQKMNFAIPTYICRKDDSAGRTPHFSCTVEIGEIQYIGATARTKKEAEIKAARTALLAIQSSGNAELGGKTQYSVVPCKRKVPETALPQVETVKAKKQKKPRSKNKRHKNQPGNPGDQIQAGNMVDGNMGIPSSAQESLTTVYNGQILQCLASSSQDIGHPYMNKINGEAFAGEGNSGSQVIVNGDNAYSTASNHQKDSDVNTLPADTSVPLPEANIEKCSTGDIHIVNAPVYMQSDASHVDSGIAHGVDNSTFMTNASSSEQ